MKKSEKNILKTLIETLIFKININFTSFLILRIKNYSLQKQTSKKKNKTTLHLPKNEKIPAITLVNYYTFLSKHKRLKKSIKILKNRTFEALASIKWIHSLKSSSESLLPNS